MYTKQIRQAKLIKHTTVVTGWATQKSLIGGDSIFHVMVNVMHRFLACAVELECRLWLSMIHLLTVTCSSDTWLSIEYAFLWLHSSSSSWFWWSEFVPQEIPDLPFRMGQLLLL